MDIFKMFDSDISKSLNVIYVSNDEYATVTAKLFTRLFNELLHFPSLCEASAFIDNNNKIDLVIKELASSIDCCASIATLIRGDIPSHIPVIVLSGTRIERNGELCKNNMIEVVLKPIELGPLLKIILELTIKS